MIGELVKSIHPPRQTHVAWSCSKERSLGPECVHYSQLSPYHSQLCSIPTFSVQCGQPVTPVRERGIRTGQVTPSTVLRPYSLVSTRVAYNPPTDIGSLYDAHSITLSVPSVFHALQMGPMVCTALQSAHKYGRDSDSHTKAAEWHRSSTESITTGDCMSTWMSVSEGLMSMLGLGDSGARSSWDGGYA